MRTARAFRWLWRLNAVIIAATGILAAVVLMFAAYYLFRDVTRIRQVSGIVNIEDQNRISASWTYGPLRRVRGTDFAVLELQSQQSYALNFASGKEAAATRNLLLVDVQTGAQRWLLDRNDSLIASHAFLPQDYDTTAESQPVTLIVCEIVTVDTDGDGRLDRGDKVTLVLARPDGSGAVELIRNADAINGYLLRRPDMLIVAYEDDGTAHLATVRIADFTILADEPIALPGPRT